MDPIYIVMILAYWLVLSGIIFLAGAAVSRIIITGPSDAELCCPGAGERYFGDRAAKYLFLAALLTFLVNPVHFVLHCAVMTETPLKDIFSILPLFLTKTKFGKFTILKTIILGIVLAVSMVGALQDRKWTTYAGAVLSLTLLVLISMSGHQGTSGYLNYPFFLDVFHFIAVSLWIGGIFFIRFFLSFFLRGTHDKLWPSLAALSNRFSQLATYCVFITILTGILLWHHNLNGFGTTAETDYGLVLLAKVLLVGIIVIFGATNKYFVIPRINEAIEQGSYARLKYSGRLLHLVTIEMVLAMAVLLLTSILTHFSPGV